MNDLLLVSYFSRSQPKVVKDKLFSTSLQSIPVQVVVLQKLVD
jgi:hypothetical protein